MHKPNTEFVIHDEKNYLEAGYILRNPAFNNKLVVFIPVAFENGYGPHRLFTDLAFDLHKHCITTLNFTSSKQENEINFKKINRYINKIIEDYSFKEVIYLSICYGCKILFQKFDFTENSKIILLSPDENIYNTDLFRLNKINAGSILVVFAENDPKTGEYLKTWETVKVKNNIEIKKEIIKGADRMFFSWNARIQISELVINFT